MTTARMVLAPLAIVALTATPAVAGSANLNCVRSGSAFNCNGTWGGDASGIPQIVHVPGPRSEQEEAQARERERKWTAYCRPIVRYDRYGVGRYLYAEPGCEFGRYD